MTTAFCSVEAARAGVSLIGSAGFFDTILAFEMRGPWAPRLVGSRASDARLDEVLVRIAQRRKDLRLLALERDGHSRGDVATVLCFERGGGPFFGFTPRQYQIDPVEIAPLLEWLALGSELDAQRRALLTERFALAVCPHVAQRHLMVCTHGGRDACCGTFGYPLYRALVEGQQGDDVTVWRCSHLGGHRFAPTLMELPSGRVFGRVNPQLAMLLAAGTRDGLADHLVSTYRGLSALPEAAQVVERELWRRRGSAWLDAGLVCQIEDTCEREGGEETPGKAATTQSALGVHLTAKWPRQKTLSVSALVARHGTALLVAPSCGKQPEPEVIFEIIAWEESAGEG